MNFKLPIFALLALLICISSCLKVDTEPPSTKTLILASHPWQIKQIYSSQSGTLYHYTRDGASNYPPPGLWKVRYIFKTNGQGTYIDEMGGTHYFHWQFLGTDETKMVVTEDSVCPTCFDYKWNMVSISENEIFQTTYSPNQNLLITAKLIPAG